MTRTQQAHVFAVQGYAAVLDALKQAVFDGDAKREQHCREVLLPMWQERRTSLDIRWFDLWQGLAA